MISIPIVSQIVPLRKGCSILLSRRRSRIGGFVR